MNRAKRRVLGSAGFTVVEILIYLVIATVVVVSVYQLLIGQNRAYTQGRELMDARSTLRGAAALLAWELRQASPADGDLYSISPTAFALRSVQGTGAICAEHPTQLRYGLARTFGDFAADATDSMLVFAVGGTRASDDAWKVVKITSVTTGPTADIATCFWGDTLVGRGKGKTTATGKSSWTGNVAPERVINISGDVDDVYIGAPVRAFRRVEYGLYQDDGRWWLGRKVGNSASYEKLTGPLRAPADSGLALRYFDRSGIATADPTKVELIEIFLHAESYGKVARQSGAPAVQTDSLRTRVSLRG